MGNGITTPEKARRWIWPWSRGPRFWPGWKVRISSPLLQTRGLLDADACASRLQSIHAKLTELRRERRRLLQNEELEDVMEALRRTADTVRAGPERLEGFDETLFADLIERITAESNTSLRFRLRGGIELTERLREVSR